MNSGIGQRAGVIATGICVGMLTACGGGGGSSSSDSGWEGDFSDVKYSSVKTVADAGASEASRFVTQATFGANLYEVNWLLENDLNYAAWIDHQLALAPTLHASISKSAYQNGRLEAWWKASIEAPDQLRQRMAWAWSQIFVISDLPDLIHNAPEATIDYYDMLVSKGLGNFRDLMEGVTRHLAMGIYLSMKNSSKADEETGAHPDENYAREVMQLFTIGLYELNQDGSRVMANGEPVPSYSQQDVEELARAFTGWSSDSQWRWKWDWLLPMAGYDEYHDTGAKTILGSSIPAGKTASEDLDAALDILFNHPNVGPFIGKQLIQRLVTSNPSAGYVSRVAAAFNDNGAGVRGDIQAVVKAILLDDEARRDRTPSEGFGKVREPLIKLTQLWRAFNLDADTYEYWRPEDDMHQAPLRSPSVFNFYYPDYRPADTWQGTNLVAPEFQLLTDASLTTSTNRLLVIAMGDFWNTITELDTDLAESLTGDEAQLLDFLDLLLTQGNMTLGLRSTLSDHLAGHPDLTDSEKVRDLIYLIVSSAEFAVQQ